MATLDQNKSSRNTSEPENQPSLPGQRLLWVDNPAAVNRLILGLSILCGILFLLDFVIRRYSYFAAEAWYGFYAIAGFVAFTLVVLGAKMLRVLIRRDETYYSPHSVDTEDYPQRGLQQLDHPVAARDNRPADDGAGQ